MQNCDGAMVGADARPRAATRDYTSMLSATVEQGSIADLEDFGFDDAIRELQRAQRQLDDTIRELRFKEAQLGDVVVEMRRQSIGSQSSGEGFEHAMAQRDEAFENLESAKQSLNEALQEREDAFRQRDHALQRERVLEGCVRRLSYSA
mmetsp:Transcript_51493/g.134499  ORF Transcript_51493/g.134499 Transcript_51493/m.134499 type:complete len:149 (+) Transcript_51493:65-511(+)